MPFKIESPRNERYNAYYSGKRAERSRPCIHCFAEGPEIMGRRGATQLAMKAFVCSGFFRTISQPCLGIE